MSPGLSEEELQFYYYGFYAALKRYRIATVLGWIIVLAGTASVPLACESGMPHGLMDIVLSAGTIAAGLGLVSQSISSLQSYVNVSFPRTNREGKENEASAAVQEIVRLMKDVDEGGWQEASAAMRRLKELETTHGFPLLN
jgi:hypothetical protein